MKKAIEIHQDGFVWHVPCEAIADNRAKYYAKVDPDTSYDEEYKITLEDDYELHDWFLNNMNLSDVPGGAILIKTPATPSQPDLREDFAANVVHLNESAG